MNIINRKTAASDADPFSVSDRTPIGRQYGKGDRSRTLPGRHYRDEVDRIFKHKPRKVGRE
jgi:hypothetical protein